MSEVHALGGGMAKPSTRRTENDDRKTSFYS